MKYSTPSMRGLPVINLSHFGEEFETAPCMQCDKGVSTYTVDDKWSATVLLQRRLQTTRLDLTSGNFPQV